MCSEKKARRVLITAALPYVNNAPHLGNIVGSSLSADVFARYSRMRGYETLFVCGSDEYGTAVEIKALEEKTTCASLCERYHGEHRKVYDWFQLSFDTFGRTATPAHTEFTQKMFERMHSNGLFSEQSTEQLYCGPCRMFLADRFVEGTCYLCGYPDARGDQCDGCGKLLNATELVSPRCKLCGVCPEKKETTHLFLDLPLLQERCSAFFKKVSAGESVFCASGEAETLRSSSRAWWSRNTLAITKKWLDEGLKTRCITRDLRWGVPVPDSKGLSEKVRGKVFYVWFDAPIGYISMTAEHTADWERWWRSKDTELFQFMGKDNVPFHSVVFPACLLGSGEDWVLPKVISATEYLGYEGEKFSKSRGVGVFGRDVMETGIPCSVWRFYLVSIRPEQSDTDFSWENLATKCNTELLGNLGNFVNRVCSFIFKRTDGAVPDRNGREETELERSFVAGVDEELARYFSSMENARLSAGLRSAMAMSALGNRYLSESGLTAKLLDTDRERCAVILLRGINLVYLLAGAVMPFIPETGQEMCRILGRQSTRIEERFTLQIESGHRIEKPAHLFKRIDSVEDLKKRFGGEQTK
ncbi:MAG: methionyl-tRNA synthetase [Amphiamblys sp. WSBS2006]|nr:MAG: methionyl-tRNA synthetase [Amphiamblys sp. WSBS2006]